MIGLLPPQLSLIHGPGCPVCVTPVSLVDKAISLALRKDVILCSYGDMLRVPGTKLSLLEARSAGADIRILYTPLEAVSIARDTRTNKSSSSPWALKPPRPQTRSR